MGVPLWAFAVLMPTRSACCGLRAECPDPCVSKGHAQKINKHNYYYSFQI
ncbi:MAG: hypothetical protein RML38_02135 [Bacteroidia bacterium]|nr:hypothetical protein [Bacteroidia bacterium]